MKTRYLVFITLLISNGHIFAQNQQLKKVQNQADMLADLFEPDSRTNLTIIAHTNCPPQYTNTVSNTNLFTVEEQELLKEVFSKYKNVTTNSGPLGTVLTVLDNINGYWVAHFTYTNVDAHENIIFGDRSTQTRHNGNYSDFVAQLGLPLAEFRTKDGDGYDVTTDLTNAGKVSAFAQIKQGKVNGLFVDFSNDKCQDLLRFVNGKAIGQWLQWDTYTDNHLLEVKIKSPLDYFKYMTQEITN